MFIGRYLLPVIKIISTVIEKKSREASAPSFKYDKRFSGKIPMIVNLVRKGACKNDATTIAINKYIKCNPVR